ncbi:DUF943 family protein [Rosenbergiella epipactidis]|uniref:DUF943 family protein n=1 Tax=Rosenbergiella epipactidis TaxID=1544694 RepID=UPI0020274C2E|nr:DUF943 family protein [Rosenbergiella epipactidis]MCL9667178.1 DUF943 family protein [Rosenbergiella epipactidis]
MFNFKRIAAIMFFLIVAYCIWIAARPAKIVRVDKSTVFVQYLPMTAEGKLKWWLKNRALLQKEYQIISTPDNFTVVIMNFSGYERLPTGTRDGSVDDYTCFDDADDGHKKCVYNSIAIVIRGGVDSKVFVNIGDKTYIQSSDGWVILK